MARLKSLLIWLTCAALLTAACGGADGDPEAYCEALEAMYRAQPASGPVTYDFAAEMNAYADAVMTAAEAAPGDQRGSLNEFADFLRDLGVDPQADGTATRAFSLLAAMAAVERHATTECGIDVVALEAEQSSRDPAPALRTDVTAVPADRIEAANALVPARFDLEFESRVTPDEEFPVIAMAPIGWEMDEFFGTTFEPSSATDFGFFTEMTVGAHCDGICAPREWQDLMDDAHAGPFAGLADAATILRDEALTDPIGRSVAYRTDSTINPVEIVVARWDDRAERYFRCTADLDEEDVELWEAFATACEAAIPLWLPGS